MQTCDNLIVTALLLYLCQVIIQQTQIMVTITMYHPYRLRFTAVKNTVSIVTIVTASSSTAAVVSIVVIGRTTAAVQTALLTAV